MKRFRLVKVADYVNTCDCCGRSNLQKTLELVDTDSDDVVHYGTTCTGIALGINAKDAAKRTRSAIERLEEARRDAEREASAPYTARLTALVDAAIAAHKDYFQNAEVRRAFLESPERLALICASNTAIQAARDAVDAQGVEL